VHDFEGARMESDASAAIGGWQRLAGSVALIAQDGITA
jgi:hypothetical protein